MGLGNNVGISAVNYCTLNYYAPRHLINQRRQIKLSENLLSPLPSNTTSLNMTQGSTLIAFFAPWQFFTLGQYLLQKPGNFVHL